MTIDNPNTPWQDVSQIALPTPSPFADGSTTVAPADSAATGPQWRANYNQVSPLFSGSYESTGYPGTAQTAGTDTGTQWRANYNQVSPIFPSGGGGAGQDTAQTSGYETAAYPGSTQTASTDTGAQWRANYNQVAPEFPNGTATPYSPQGGNGGGGYDTGQYGTPPDVNQTPIVVAPQTPAGGYPTQQSGGYGTGTPEKQMPPGSYGGPSPNFQPGTGDTGGQASQSSPSDTSNTGSNSNTPTPSWSQIPNSSGDGGFVSAPPPPQPSESPYRAAIAGGLGGVTGQYLVRVAYRGSAWIQERGAAGGGLTHLLSPVAGQIHGAIEQTPSYQKVRYLEANTSDLNAINGPLQDYQDRFDILSGRENILRLGRKQRAAALNDPAKADLFTDAERTTVLGKTSAPELATLRTDNTDALAVANDRLDSLQQAEKALRQRQTLLTGTADRAAMLDNPTLNPRLLQNRYANGLLSENPNELDPSARAGFGPPLEPAPGGTYPAAGDMSLINDGRIRQTDLAHLRAAGVPEETVVRLESPSPTLTQLGAPFDRRVPTVLR
ncbi:MAG TPA: hypothetical protein V6C72_09840, partial [Chroococcales cyanobacterium]